MKRFFCFLIAAVISLGCVSASAYDGEWDNLGCIGGGRVNVNLKMQYDGDGKMLDKYGPAENDGMRTSGSFNIITDGNTVKADGTYSKITRYGHEDTYKLWLDSNMTSAEEYSNLMLVKACNENALSRALNGRYLYIDFSTLPGKGELYAKLPQVMQKFGSADESLADFIKYLLRFGDIFGQIKPEYSDGGYTVTVSEAQLKELVTVFVNRLKAMMGEDWVKENIGEGIIEWVDVRDLHLFDWDRAFVLNVKCDKESGKTDVYAEVNYDMDYYWMLETINPGNDKNKQYDSDEYRSKMSVKINAEVTPLADSYKVDYPEVYEDDVCRIERIGESFNEPVDIYRNGKFIYFKNEVVCRDGKIYVPLRELANILGTDNDRISYSAETGQIIIYNGDTDLYFKEDGDEVLAKGEILKMDTPLITVNDKTYLPVQYVAPLFGRGVFYMGSRGR